MDQKAPIDERHFVLWPILWNECVKAINGKKYFAVFCETWKWAAPLFEGEIKQVEIVTNEDSIFIWQGLLHFRLPKAFPFVAHSFCILQCEKILW